LQNKLYSLGSTNGIESVMLSIGVRKCTTYRHEKCTTLA